jgi:transposase InsO family protein
MESLLSTGPRAGWGHLTVAKERRLARAKHALHEAGADTSIPGRRARELTALIDRRGTPAMIVLDHGTEFTCNAMLTWSEDNQVAWHFIAPGKPTQNGFCESFNC